MRVIGTAGHVDHGKSTLVKALTGINPDRLKEEQEREMTIDLGFAWMTLPNGEQVSIVDVPGHEDFIKNMLAGVGGIDAAVLVIAADEGVMPQTREHLAILDLLKVRSGVVALTKTDLVFDPEWLELVKLDIAELLEATALAGSEILPVSARNGTGLKELVAELQRLLGETPARRDLGRGRLPIDRVFTIAGFGTIVTGTLIDGSLKVGDEVEIVPRGLKARIRGLQTHKAKVETAVPGSRVAANLTGVAVDDLQRGDAVVHPGWLVPTVLADVRVDVLADAPRALAHNVEVEFYSGAAQIPCRTRILGAAEIPPGGSGWAQLRLQAPAALVKGDRFILRLPSPSLTIGGGTVVDPYPRARHRRFSTDVIERLETLAHGDDAEVLLAAIRRDEPCQVQAALQGSGLSAAAGARALAALLESGQVITVEASAPTEQAAMHAAGTPGQAAKAVTPGPQTLIISATGWQALQQNIAGLVGDFHRQYPLRPGMPREELKSRLRMGPRAFVAAVDRMIQAGQLGGNATVVSLAGHRPAFSPAQQAEVDRLLASLARAPYTTPLIAEVEAQVGADVFAALVEQGPVTKVSNEVFFLTPTYREMVERIVAHLRSHGKITVAEVRDMFSASRKYALALMEHLDQQRITRRVGDERVLRGA
jgi:selenocysteine-specific elongation factor